MQWGLPYGHAANAGVRRKRKRISINSIAFTIIAISLAMLSFSASAEIPLGAKYIAGTNSDVAVILAHGRGKHPAWKVVNPLRKGIYKKLGYHTLSLQMPNEKKHWKKYTRDFPEAYETIRKGIRFLRKERRRSSTFICRSTCPYLQCLCRGLQGNSG